MKVLNSSFRDIYAGGYVFNHNDAIYRCISNKYRENYDFLISSGLYDKLVMDEILVSHEEISNIEQFNMFSDDVYKIIKPIQLPYISYPYEWSFHQLKDAALLTLKVLLEALKYNMILKDATAFNIQFYNGKPIFIDTLSFEKYKDGSLWQAYSQFCRHFLAPLALISYTDYRLFHASMNFIDGIPLDYAANLLPIKSKFKLGIFMHLHLNAKVHRKAEKESHDNNKKFVLKKSNLINLIENLVNTINGIDYNTKKGKSNWNGYYSFTNYDEDSFTQKEKILIELVSKCDNSKKIVDLGANNGHFSRLLCGKYSNSIIISSDMDYHAVDENYLILKANECKNIYPIVTDLTNPTPSIGWANKERDSFIARLSGSDITLALALIHHITITNNVPFNKSAEFFASFTKYLIIEWVPKNDSQTMKILDENIGDYSYYTIENFEKSFERHFTILERVAIDNTKRILYLMKLK